MKRMLGHKIFLFGVAAVVLTGCANPYRANYNSTRDRFPNWIEGRLAPKVNSPRLMLTNDISAENWRLFERGYVMVGFSKFAGPNTDAKLALAEAKAAGAELVLLQKTFAKTLTETVTVTNFPPSETTTVRENTNVLGGKQTKSIERRLEVTTSRSPETYYVPKQVDYYEHSATFWRKLEKPFFGALVKDLPDELKAKLQTNLGLVVRAIVLDSPAYAADLLKDDIILKIDGAPVPSAQKFYESIITKAGTEIELSVLRGDKTLSKRIRLNP
jgi:C-terminal processing protease CtpA/Prc